MAIWLKVVLWVAVLFLPGGLLLSPLLWAVHRRDGDRRGLPRDPDPDVTPTVTV